MKLIRNYEQVLLNAKYCWQRIRRGYSDRDLKNMPEWFLDVIPSMLQQLKAEECNKKSESIRGDFYQQQWISILDKMIILFMEADMRTSRQRNDYETDYYSLISKLDKKYAGVYKHIIRMQEGNISKRNFPDEEIMRLFQIENKYFAEEQKLEAYREDCRNKAFKLLCENFWYL